MLRKFKFLLFTVILIIFVLPSYSQDPPEFDSSNDWFKVGWKTYQDDSAAFNKLKVGIATDYIDSIYLDTDTFKIAIGSKVIKVPVGLLDSLDNIISYTETSVADNDIVAYDNGTGEYINQDAGELGLATSSDLTEYSDTAASAAPGYLALWNSVYKLYGDSIFWNSTNRSLKIGDYSYNSGNSSTVIGDYDTITNDWSIALGGQGLRVSGERSGAYCGYNNKVLNYFAVIAGGENDTLRSRYGFGGGGLDNYGDKYYSGWLAGRSNYYMAEYFVHLGGSNKYGYGTYGATLGGTGLLQHDFAEVVAGTYNTEATGDSVSNASGNRLFVVGNGTSGVSRSNAFEVYNDGKIIGNGYDLNQTYIAWAISDSTTELTTANGADVPAVYDCTIDSVLIIVAKAPTGSTLTFDILKNGSTIFNTTPTIDAGEISTATAATPYALSTTSLAWNDRLTGKVTSVGTTYGGSGAVIVMYITRN